MALNKTKYSLVIPGKCVRLALAHFRIVETHTPTNSIVLLMASIKKNIEILIMPIKCAEVLGALFLIYFMYVFYF